ncbi:MAG: hypothetical protein IH949_13565, partial [Bacteroidetes bacterium]|nr:hypothetical protein [Bacteroidota bacterium]
RKILIYLQFYQGRMLYMKINEVLKRYKDKILNIENVVGVGIGNRKNQEIMVVMVSNLNDDIQKIPKKIENYKVEVREIDDKVIFLHKVNPGRADHSYGIQVAQMAGLPKFVTNRAKEILENLETKELTSYETRKEKLSKLNREEQNQINMFEIKDDKLRDEIEEIQIDDLTPIEALNKLNELKRKVKGEKKK